MFTVIKDDCLGKTRKCKNNYSGRVINGTQQDVVSTEKDFSKGYRWTLLDVAKRLRKLQGKLTLGCV